MADRDPDEEGAAAEDGADDEDALDDGMLEDDAELLAFAGVLDGLVEPLLPHPATAATSSAHAPTVADALL